MTPEELHALAMMLAAAYFRPAARMSPAELAAWEMLRPMLGVEPGFAYDPGTGSLIEHIEGRLRPLIVREHHA
jgi:hypothetical protein